MLCDTTCMTVLQWFIEESHQIVKAARVLQASSSPTSLFKAGSTQAGFSVPCPVRFQISPIRETRQPLWAICSVSSHPYRKLLCFAGVCSISMSFFFVFQAAAIAHCSFHQEVLNETISQTSINTNLGPGLSLLFLHRHPEVTTLVPISVLLPLVWNRAAPWAPVFCTFHLSLS